MLRESNGIYDNVHKRLPSHLDSVRNRTYLWVSAIFSKHVRDVYASEYVLMEAIDSMPENVQKAYENILAKSPEKPILERVLHIMLAAFRPLSLSEMNMALSIRDTLSDPKYNNLHQKNTFGT